jgi:hypothetical protein
MSKDPLGFGAGDQDLYGVEGNNAILRVDPSGLDWDPWTKDWWQRQRQRVKTGAVLAVKMASYQFQQTIEQNPWLFHGPLRTAWVAAAKVFAANVLSKGYPDTNPATVGYWDLFKCWLFLVGPPSWNFGPNDNSTQFIIQHSAAQAQQAQNILQMQQALGVPFPVTPIQFEFTAANYFSNLENPTPELFTGSYNGVAYINPQNPNVIQFYIWNLSGWESGSRCLGGGKAIFSNQSRDDDQAIPLGGDMWEYWQWSVTLP